MTDLSGKFIFTIGFVAVLGFGLGFISNEAVDRWSVPAVLIGALAGGVFTLGSSFLSGWFQLQQVSVAHELEQSRIRGERDRTAAQSIIKSLDEVQTLNATLMARLGTAEVPLLIGKIGDAVSSLLTQISGTFPELDDIASIFASIVRRTSVSLKDAPPETSDEIWSRAIHVRALIRDYIVYKFIHNKDVPLPPLGRTELLEVLRTDVRGQQVDNAPLDNGDQDT